MLRPPAREDWTIDRLLDELRIGAGDVVFLHTSFSRLRYLALSPSELIGAVLARLGRDGTLAMPSYAWHLDPTGRPWKGYAEYFARRPPFDVRRTPSNMGAVPEAFRAWKGVQRSLDFWWPICVVGPLAEAIVAGQETVVHPYGPGSAFARLQAAGVKMLGLGVTLNTTSLALIPDLLLGPRHPHRVFTDEPQSATVIDAEGSARVTRSFWLLPEVVRLIKPSAVFELSESLTGRTRRADVGDTIHFAYRFEDYCSEAMRLAGEALAEGHPLPWLRQLPLANQGDCE
jgi:aminoglycoside N3'-acetyltransferase